MSIATAHRPVPAGDPDRTAQHHAALVRQPEHREHLAVRLDQARALLAGITAGLRAAASDLGLDVAIGVEANLILAEQAIRDLVPYFAEGDLWQTLAESAARLEWRAEVKADNLAHPIYTYTDETIAVHDAAVRIAARRKPA